VLTGAATQDVGAASNRHRPAWQVFRPRRASAKTVKHTRAGGFHTSRVRMHLATNQMT
jgi:hypothetical protein